MLGPDHPSIPTLNALARSAADNSPLVVAQLGQSLDGRIATPTGHSHYVNGPAAITLLHALRAGVDAVIVGAGTVAADDPQLTVRHLEGPDPARVIIDRTRRAGGSLKCLRNDGTRRIVVGGPHPDDPEGLEFIAPPESGPVDAGSLIEALRDRGLSRVLVEGGSTTVSGFLAAGALDRLCILVGPMVLGSGPIGLNLPPIETVQEAVVPDVAVVPLPGGDVVFDCDLRVEARQ